MRTRNYLRLYETVDLPTNAFKSSLNSPNWKYDAMDSVNKIILNFNKRIGYYKNFNLSIKLKHVLKDYKNQKEKQHTLRCKSLGRSPKRIILTKREEANREVIKNESSRKRYFKILEMKYKSIFNNKIIKTSIAQPK